MRKSWIALALVLGCAASASAVELTLKDAGDLRLQIYGYVRGDYSYDSQSTAPKSDFSFYVLPETAGEKDGQTHVGARESRFGLSLFGPDVGNWKTTGKIEMDFYGGDKANSYNPRMRLAFVDMAHSSGLSVRIGQDWDTFCELAPRIVNFANLADVGALGLRRPQARVTQELKFSENTKLVLKLAAAQTVGEDLDGGGFEDGGDADSPSAQWNVTLSQKLWTEKMARLSFAGHYGQETIDGVDSNKVVIATDVKDYDTWSAQGSLYLPLCKKMAVQGNIWTGENLDTYYGGIGQGVNMVLAEAIAADGGFAQILFDPTDQWAFGLGYSVDDPDDADLSAGMRSKNEMYLVNAAYKFTAALTAMAEYSQMTTEYLDKDDATNDRVQVAMKYTF
jgi:hypothetical protein